MERVRLLVQWLMAAGLGAWNGVPELTQALLVLMAIDFAMGLVCSIKSGQLEQRGVWDAVTRKMGGLGVVLVMAVLQPHVGEAIGVDLVRASSAFYIIPELTGITRHAQLLGVPMPKQLSGIVSYFDKIAGQDKKGE